MFTLPFFWLPVIYIYLTRVKGLSTGETMFLLGLQELLMIFLEVPTGVVADKFSRKFSVGLGHILTCLPFIVFWVSSNYWVFVGIFTVKAVGKALVSGADTSLLYDTLVDLGKTNEYKKILASSKFLTLSVVAACIFIGGLMADKYMEWTLVLPIPFMLIAAMAAFLMTEPETSKTAKKLQEVNYLKHVGESLRYVLSSRTILILTAVFSINEAMAVNMKWIYTPIFEALNMNLSLMGGITALLYLAKSLMAGLSTKILSNNLRLNMTLGMAVTVLLFGLIIIDFKQATVIVALLGIILASEIMDASIEEGIHNKLASHNRATVMSVINLFSSIVATIMINGFGIAQGLSGLNGGLLVIIVIFGIGSVMSILTESKEKLTI